MTASASEENAIPSPVVFEGAGIFVSGFRGSAGLSVSLDGKGDVTGTDKVRWKVSKGTPYVPSPVLWGDRIWFVAGNGNALTCLEARTGKTVLDGTRLESLKTVYASPVAAAGRIYLVDREGTAVVIRAGDSLEVLATNRLDDGFSATPAIAGKQLFLRGARRLYCIEEAAGEGKTTPAGGKTRRF